MPRPVHLAGQRLRRRPDKCDAGRRPSGRRIPRRRPSGRRIPRPAASGRTRSLRCTAFFPPKLLRWVSAGALLWEVIKLPFCIFGISMWGWYHYPLAALSVSEQPGAGFISAEKRLSQSGCSAPTDTPFPPAHSAFSALLCGGGITTLGVRFIPLKRWTPAGHGGLFAVFMPLRCSPGAGRISPRRVHTPPQPPTAHTAAHRAKHGAFSPPETAAGSIGSTA